MRARFFPHDESSALTVYADDWPQWRGPERDGNWRENGTLRVFPTQGLTVRWRVPVGPGWASPVIGQGRVVITDSVLQKPRASERVRCFDEITGRLIWSYVYEVNYPEWAFSAENGNGPAATPVVADGNVYALGSSGEAICLRVESGDLVWRRDFGKEFEVAVLQCRSSPLIEGDKVVMQVGGKPGPCMIALDRATGAIVWKALDEPVSNSSPIVVEAGGQRQVIIWTGESVTSLAPATGATFWREPMTTSNNDDIATPVALGNRLLVSGLMFELAPDKPTAHVIWPENRGVLKRVLSDTSTPLLTADAVYSALRKGELVCLDAKTGAELWREKSVTDSKAGAAIHLTPNGESVLIYTNRGELIRARLAPSGYEEMSRTTLIEPVFPFSGRNVVWAAPSYANRHVFVRNERELVCASLAAGP